MKIPDHEQSKLMVRIGSPHAPLAGLSNQSWLATVYLANSAFQKHTERQIKVHGSACWHFDNAEANIFLLVYRAASPAWSSTLLPPISTVVTEI